ncbi:MAG: ribonuclease P protein subunit [Euryarchaeota archaeon]|nr:ribonuclease P protein subunit [Euryarchaeota archaeon]
MGEGARPVASATLLERPQVAEATPLDLMGEFLGAHLTILHAPGWQRLPWEGVVVDETRNTFRVVPTTGGHQRTLPKGGLEALVTRDGKAVHFIGDELRHRPEDRIKRLAPKGRSRRP